MNKNCARCTKIVYPIEELKCLDKTWHKTCFKCHECGMTLNMKTYKGFNKLPYCEAHIPKAKATAIADTPELKRIAENTKIQSNVKYHADFEKQKGKLTQVADDPETLRMKQNSKIISNVAYHGDLEKKAAMEKQREVAEIADNRDNESEYFSETLAAESLSQYQPSPKHTQHPIVPIQQYNSKQHESIQSQNSQLKQQQQQQQQHYQSSNVQYPSTQQKYQQPEAHSNNTHHNTTQLSYQSQIYAQQQQQQQHQHQQQKQLQQKYYEQYENYTSVNNNNHANSNSNSNSNVSMAYNNAHHVGYSNNSMAHGNPVQYNSAMNNQVYGGDYNTTLNSNAVPIGAGIGKISDYDPITDGPRNIPNTTRPSSTLIYSSDRGMVSNNQPRKIGSIADIDPLNGVYGSVDYTSYAQQQQHQLRYTPQQQQQQTIQQPIQQNQQSAIQQKPKSISSQVRVFRALYDYEAQDTDEVSFTEGDLIFEVDSIDAGWMTGQVQRTRQTGMLPANYVEPANI